MPWSDNTPSPPCVLCGTDGTVVVRNLSGQPTCADTNGCLRARTVPCTLCGIEVLLGITGCLVDVTPTNRQVVCADARSCRDRAASSREGAPPARAGCMWRMFPHFADVERVVAGPRPPGTQPLMWKVCTGHNAMGETIGMWDRAPARSLEESVPHSAAAQELVAAAADTYVFVAPDETRCRKTCPHDSRCRLSGDHGIPCSRVLPPKGCACNEANVTMCGAVYAGASGTTFICTKPMGHIDGDEHNWHHDRERGFRWQPADDVDKARKFYLTHGGVDTNPDKSALNYWRMSALLLEAKLDSACSYARHIAGLWTAKDE
jgi:hypothetical protein